MTEDKDVQKKTLSNRREFLFLYDIKMGNPNGDPDENRPRVLPDGTYYVTDVRLKRFVRDWLKVQGYDILVDKPEEETTNLAGRVKAYLDHKEKKELQGKELVSLILDSFIDARLFGSSLAFKKERGGSEGQGTGQDKWDPKPVPKTLTGAVQMNHGEVIHKATAVDIAGTSVFASTEEKTQGTFTTYFGLRYGLIAFNGVANEYSAKLSRLTDDDYDVLLDALWKSVRGAPSANTRTKVGQVPRFLVDITYNPKSEFQFGCLLDYVKVTPANGLLDNEIASPKDYTLGVSILVEKLKARKDKIKKVRYAVSPDIKLSEKLDEGLAGMTVEEFDPDKHEEGEDAS